MNREVFGVFGGREAFDRYAGNRRFDRVVAGAAVTVGIRDPALGLPGRSDVATGDDGFAVVWGEAFAPADARESAAEWLVDAVRDRGTDAFGSLNGSYVAVVEVDGDPVVATDPIRSRECFATRTDDGRVFGTDAATVAGTIPDPTVDARGFAEFLYLGGALGDHTLLRDLERLPLDHALTPAGTLALGRYRHEPAGVDADADADARPVDVDPAAELGRRLERAIARRTGLPGRHAVMLSAGYDSRLLLACRDDVDVAYTLGPRDSDEVAVARRLADRTGVEHVTLPVDDRYLALDTDAIRATNGVRESLHVHHAGHADAIDADVVSHGLLLDTLLRGYFLPWDTRDVLGLTVPRGRLDPDPDPVDHLAGVMGYLPATADLVARTPGVDADTADDFLATTIGDAYRTCRDAATDEYAAFERFGVSNVLATPFRAHLADRFTESLFAADADLVDWHLRTPPAARTDATFREALRQIDPGILDPRPPDRPHDSLLANQIEKRARRSIPGLTPFDAPWPDRRAAYAARDLDAHILPDRPDLHDYPPRFKLRVRDLRRWLDLATDGGVDVDELLPRRA